MLVFVPVRGTCSCKLRDNSGYREIDIGPQWFYDGSWVCVCGCTQLHTPHVPPSVIFFFRIGVLMQKLARIIIYQHTIKAAQPWLSVRCIADVCCNEISLWGRCPWVGYIWLSDLPRGPAGDCRLWGHPITLKQTLKGITPLSAMG